MIIFDIFVSISKGKLTPHPNVFANILPELPLILRNDDEHEKTHGIYIHTHTLVFTSDSFSHVLYSYLYFLQRKKRLEKA